MLRQRPINYIDFIKKIFKNSSINCKLLTVYCWSYCVLYIWAYPSFLWHRFVQVEGQDTRSKKKGHDTSSTHHSTLWKPKKLTRNGSGNGPPHIEFSCTILTSYRAYKTQLCQLHDWATRIIKQLRIQLRWHDHDYHLRAWWDHATWYLWQVADEFVSPILNTYWIDRYATCE